MTPSASARPKHDPAGDMILPLARAVARLAAKRQREADSSPRNHD